MYLDFPPLYVLDNGSQLQVEWLAQVDHYPGLVPGPDNINLAAACFSILIQVIQQPLNANIKLHFTVSSNVKKAWSKFYF